ncbi:MAG: tRNA (adenosine(37)-N6)-threonylcarbamoyltransferase complex transferase subunit TsaD [Bacteroidetes bacterium]|nr:tRNA (adenosine(37)-N6)-threonylcarbamoyltransferase complex transferase subunit TsaD [Bacteroidota bacterium]
MTLAIETSCDETSIAVIDKTKVLSNIISTQYIHKNYGGVIPEIAAREHLKSIAFLTKEALLEANISMPQIKKIAVTTQPGLVGALIVGSNFAKGLAIRYNIPIIPVNHIEGHIFSGFIAESNENIIPSFPIISLVVSGGHTAIFYVKDFNNYDIIGTTKDDAAGEAFDKIAKLCGLDYPGGPLIDKYAKLGNKNKYSFPRPMINTNDFDFSFSGLKTSVRYFLQKQFPDGITADDIPDIAASVQSAIVDVLVTKTVNAAKKYNSNSIIIAGGVSANSHLREQIVEHSNKHNISCIIPKMGYCIDNAAMIGYIAEMKYSTNNNFYKLDFTVSPNNMKK